jgi:hypothetical protein
MMKGMTRFPSLLAGIGTLALALGLPLLGRSLAGRSFADLFHFPPPLQIPTDYLRFSWVAAALVALVLAATFAPWLRHRSGTTPAAAANAEEEAAPRRHRLPCWGYLAMAWTAGWWIVAWSRFPVFAPWQHFTFLPLWLGLVVTVNAFTHARSRSCFMLRAPGRWLALFAASAACWWTFEWFNRFVNNWHYLNIAHFGAATYALHASLSFSTVLPAMAAVAEWLLTHSRWRHRVADGPRWAWLAGRPAAPLLFGGGAVAMVGAGALPDWFYPTLWIGPLALLLPLPGPRGRSRLADEIATGDWTRAATWMAAALVCGFFWELWNWHSLAKWIYTVPGVDRWHLFEMPALGYAGYLPFGLECLLVTERVIGSAWQRSPGNRGATGVEPAGLSSAGTSPAAP